MSENTLSTLNTREIKEIKEIKEEFEEKTGHKIVYLTASGSRLYGTNTPKSDLDVKGIFIPTKESVLLKQDLMSYTRDTRGTRDIKSKNLPDDIDFSIHSIYAFFNQLEKSETGAVDVLFSMFREDTIIYEDKAFTDTIKANYKFFLNKNMKSFIGYALNQAKKYSIKGERYKELDVFVKDFKNKFKIDDTRLQLRYKDIKIYIKEKKFKYIKFVTTPTTPVNRNADNLYKEQEYISILGKLFLGTVTVEYFYNRIKILYNQFGNRTKTVANTAGTASTAGTVGSEKIQDLKATSHALRIALEVRELLQNNFINFPLKDAEYLRDIKEGKAHIETVISEIQKVLSEVDVLLQSTKLPEKANREVMNKLILGMVGVVN